MGKPQLMNRLQKMTLQEGLIYLRDRPYNQLNGRPVENPAKSTRLKMFLSGQTKCISCGLQGEYFFIEHGIYEKVMPAFINLYGIKGDKEIMLTHDHFIPRSLGGSDRIDNAQCMCAHCNSKKGNFLTLSELLKINDHPSPLALYRTPGEGSIDPIRLDTMIAHAITEFNNLVYPDSHQKHLSGKVLTSFLATRKNLLDKNGVQIQKKSFVRAPKGKKKTLIAGYVTHLKESTVIIRVNEMLNANGKWVQVRDAIGGHIALQVESGLVEVVA